jgi:uncharacterized membrane protein
MLYNLLKLSHVLSILVWIGGMVFAHFFLRPAVADVLQGSDRVRLMHGTLGRFFRAILVLSTWAVLSGGVMIALARAGGSPDAPFRMPLAWTVMATLGLVMWAIFGHIRFALYKRLSRSVQAGAWPDGAQALNSIRLWVSVNMGLGLAIVALTLLA